MAKKKTRGPKKANAQKPRRRPLGRGSGPVAPEQGGHWHGDQWHAAGHEHAAGHDDPELEARLALIAEVEAIPEDDVVAALLGNPLVDHLGTVLLSGADADADPVVASPEPPLEEADVAVLARWSRAALLLETRQEADELAEEWREGGIARTIAARAALSQYLSAVVAEGTGAGGAAAAVPQGAAFGVAPDGAADDDAGDAPADARGELLVGVVGNLALTAEVDLADAPDGPARDAVRHDLRLLAAAGLLTLDGDVASIDPDLRNVLLAVADELVDALYGPEEGSDSDEDDEVAPVA